MVAVPSTMLPLGTPCPPFDLPDPSGSRHSNADFAGKPLVVAFICNHCPFVKHMNAELAQFGHDAIAAGASMVAISSNNVDKYPLDSPELMAEEASTWGYPFPYLYDASQDVAKAFRAACTPDFYVFDASGKLTYRGQFDDSRPGSGMAVTGADLYRALHSAVAGEGPVADQQASIGCNIKWKPGNEPAYFG